MKETKCYYMRVCSLEDPTLYARALECIVWEKRREAIEKYRYTKDKLLSLGVGLLLRYALTLEGVCDMTLAYGEGGKPRLLRDCGVFFNCSHSSEIAVLAISGREVGVDVEKIDGIDKRVLNRAFSPEERAWVSDDEERFYRLWTKKESYLKLLGRGLTVSLGDINVLSDGLPLGDGVFTEFSIPHYAFSVCGDRCAEFVPLTPEAILSRLRRGE